MQASSWKEQELLDERIAELEANKQELATELAAARTEVMTSQRSLAGQEAALRTLQEQLAKEKATLAAAKEQLQREQATVRSLRAKASSKVCDLKRYTGASSCSEELTADNVIWALLGGHLYVRVLES
jgi:chromosome segregation ATPase